MWGAITGRQLLTAEIERSSTPTAADALSRRITVDSSGSVTQWGVKAGWVNRANDRKDRLFKVTKVSGAPWCTILFRYPTSKSGAVKSGEHGGQLTEAQREKKTPLETVLQPGQVIEGCSCVSRWSIFLKPLLVECASVL